MLIQLMTIARFVVLLLAVTLTSRVEPLPALVILLLLAGAVVVLPTLRWLVRRVLRVLTAPAHGPPRVSRTEVRQVRKASGPGVRGSVRVRAPSRGVRAFA